MAQRRILIATATAGGGHLSAAAALEEAWKDLYPRDAVQTVDVLDFAPGLYKRVYSRGYVKLIAHAPELYGRLFRKSDEPALVRRMAGWRRGVARLVVRGFLRHVRQWAPQAVLCPHFLPLEALGSLKERPWVGCVVTDFEAHALWLEPAVDQYFVAVPETKSRLVARNVPAARVSVTGIPVSRRFRSAVPPRRARAALDLRPALPTVLVLGGGFGMGPVKEIVHALDNVRRPIQVLVVAGKNPKLAKELAFHKHRHPTRVFGFVPNIEALMAASDAVITKSGGLTTSEALALGKPLVILDPIPGQETANSDYLLERGAATKVNRPEDLPARLERLLSSSQLARMAKAARALGKPRAAAAICKKVVQCLG